MKFTIRAKILSAFSVGLAATLLLVAAVVLNNDDDTRRLTALEALDQARSLAQDLELQTSTIWQYLTDASLTRDDTVIRDNAQPALEAARNDLKELSGLTVLPDQTKLLAPLESDLLDLWTTGEAMFAAYGRSKDEGDRAMEAFDSAGATLVSGFRDLRTPLLERRLELLKGYQDNLAADRWFFLLTGAVLVALMLALGLLLARTIARPVRAASQALRTLADSQGDLTVRLKPAGNDETTALAVSVNDFLDKLRAILVAIEDMIHRNQSLASSLNESSRDSAEAVSNLGLRVTTLRKSLGSLDLDIAGASAAIEEIMANIASLAQQIRNQDLMVSRSGSAVQQMMGSITGVSEMAEAKVASVSHLVDLTRKGGDRVRATNRVIGRVADNADAMMSLIDLINDISDRTNLLAMNASIEAAHAGSAGRGFAVVANEIRKLATDTGSNAHKIAESLKETAAHIRQAQQDGMATQEAFLQLEEEVTDFAEALKDVSSAMGELSQGGIEIISATAELVQTSQVISNSSQEMDYGAKEILTAVHHVREVSSNALDDVSRVDGLAEELSRTALRVSAFGNQNRYNNTVLAGEVGRFRLGTEPGSGKGAVALGIDWNDLLSVGIDAMDDEHKELFRRINALLVSLLGPEQGADTRSLVAAIREYAEFHFDDELKLIRANGYPRADQHHQLHQSFLAEFLSIEKALLEEGLTAGNLIRLQEKVVNWLLDHIAKVDHDYGDYIAQKTGRIG